MIERVMQVNKRIFSVKSEKNLKEDNEILFENKVVGKVLISEPKTFALIKINEPGLNVLSIKDLKCNGFKVNLIKPDWLK